MARIRSVNPAAPTDEDVAKMSIWAKYVWAYLPCHADIEGRLLDKPFTLKLDILPTESVDMDVILGELAARNHIVRYKVGGRGYIQIRSFLKYQRPHKHETSKGYPPPPVFACATNAGQKPASTGQESASTLLDLGSGLLDPGILPPPAGAHDPTEEEQVAAAPVAVPDAVASAAADARGATRLTQAGLLALWKRIRDEETGTNSGPGTGGFGISPERIRDGYEQVIGEPEGPTVVEQSMRRFWRSVKAGEHSVAADCARKPSLAWACWIKDFAEDVMAARGAIPVIPKRTDTRTTGPPRGAVATHGNTDVLRNAQQTLAAKKGTA